MAISLSQVQIGLKYDVIIDDAKLTYIFGAEHKGVILTSILSYEEACRVADIATSMANALVTGVVNPIEPKSETYLKFKTTLGSTLVLPLGYIGKIKRLTAYKATFSVFNLSDTDIKLIEDTITKLGFLDIVTSKTPYDVNKENYKDTTYK